MRESLEQILKLGEQKEGVIRTELNCLREQVFFKFRFEFLKFLAVLHAGSVY